MKTKSEKQRIDELVDYIQNNELYESLFKEIERDIRKEIEKEKVKKLKTGFQKP